MAHTKLISRDTNKYAHIIEKKYTSYIPINLWQKLSIEKKLCMNYEKAASGGMDEWLRRTYSNQMIASRMGSNTARGRSLFPLDTLFSA
jgi:hypothetical protein